MWLTLIYGAAALAFRNPLIADRSYYSAAPAALVVDDVLYIAAGRDEAPPDVNDFIMREWQLFATKDVSRGKWTHYPGFLRPEQVFAWATPGRVAAAAGRRIRTLRRVFLPPRGHRHGAAALRRSRGGSGMGSARLPIYSVIR
jgi:hypothetical protein